MAGDQPLAHRSWVSRAGQCPGCGNRLCCTSFSSSCKLRLQLGQLTLHMG